MYLPKSLKTLQAKLHFLLFSASLLGTVLCLWLIFLFSEQSLHQELISRGNTITNSIILQAETRANTSVMNRFMNIAAQDSQIVGIVLISGQDFSISHASERAWLGVPYPKIPTFETIPAELIQKVIETGNPYAGDYSDSISEKTLLITQVLVNQSEFDKKAVQKQEAAIVILDEGPLYRKALATTIKTSWVILLSFALLWFLLRTGFRTLILDRLNLMRKAIHQQNQGLRHSRIPPMSADEVGELGQFLNDSFEKIAEQEERLIRAARNAEAANHTKTEFLANMSHELRTPLNAIIGFADLLHQKKLEPEAKDYAQTIHQSGEALLSLINDFLDFSKIEAGRLDLEKSNFSLHALIRESIQMLERKALNKQLEFSCDIDELVPEWICSDPGRIRQILLNLLNNAIKFTEIGKVHLHVNMLSQFDQDLHINFTVTDTGIGMDPEVLSKLFTPFTQADASITRRFGGTGLGLSICKKLCQALGGGISVFSAPGQGSSFSFNILAQKGLASKDQIQNPQSLQLLGKVLLVEDNPINQKLALLLLKKIGLKAELAEDGQIALDKISSTPDSFQLILMDRQMPVMDGVEATRQIRQKLGLQCPPIIALSANVFQEQKDELFAAGAVDFLSKPIKEKELRDCLAKWLHQ